MQELGYFITNVIVFSFPYATWAEENQKIQSAPKTSNQ